MFRLAIIVLVLPLLSAEPDWEEMWRNAQAAFAEGRDADAERALSLARAGLMRLGADDKDFAAHVKQLGDLYTNQGRFRDTERLYDESLARIPNDEKLLVRIQLLTSLGWEYIDGDRLVKACATFQKALDAIQQEYGDKSTEAGVGLGLRYIAEMVEGEFEKADATLDAAMSVNKSVEPVAPVFPVYKVENYDELINALREIAFDAYEERGKSTESEALLRRAAGLVTSLPVKTQILQKLISALRARGRIEEADHERDQLVRLLESSTSAEAAKTARDLREEVIARSQAKEKKDSTSGEIGGGVIRIGKDPWSKAVDVATAALSEKRYEAAAAAIKALLPLVPDGSRREDRHRALVKIVDFANDLAGTSARDDRIVDHVAAIAEVDLGRSPAIIRQLTEYYVKTGQSAKAYGLLDRWAEAVRARAGDDSPELAKIYAFTADVKHREKDYRRALAVCTDWIEYEQSARGRWARRTADAYLKMAEIAFDYEDFSGARANLDAGMRIADYWAWSSEDDYPSHVRRAAAVYRKLKDAEKSAELERRIKEDSK